MGPTGKDRSDFAAQTEQGKEGTWDVLKDLTSTLQEPPSSQDLQPGQGAAPQLNGGNG